ncbi:pur operon repressor [Paenibacillus sp. ACRRX]|uniref:pur operon repressor n=1 Tax=unclassified Paenibacillus TaxID=185978 RepID=UPI001EF6D4D7|nr:MULTISPECIES: pur operon repressor [unclassified Paenibacillus]MCG7410783.1 pur operon repressor [Paenibacillus sp. ACRRX]MDK8184090.1 pur operon repressor [Paenibacillus sp. UMB4589-SE434]
MKKLKRSARLVEMTQYLMSKPHTLIPLTTFAERYGAAKSSISEDLAIIKEVCESEETGELLTLAGAAGGVKYIPKSSPDKALPLVQTLCAQLEQPDRMLPGGYYYITDILGQPGLMNDIGRMFASAFANHDIDVVMTVETKGIPIAYATAAHLNLPVVLVRRDHVVTEGSAVSINYVSGSQKSIHTMTLARRALKERSRVLVVDDFMRAGGTINGMIDLLHEFNATVAGVGVLVESEDVSNDERLLHDYVSLVRVGTIDSRNRQMSVKPGNYFDK